MKNKMNSYEFIQKRCPAVFRFCTVTFFDEKWTIVEHFIPILSVVSSGSQNEAKVIKNKIPTIVLIHIQGSDRMVLRGRIQNIHFLRNLGLI